MVNVLVDGVSKQYGDNWALRDLNLRIEPGESIVLLGPTGSGKTTLLRLIAGLEEPTSGDILFDGRRPSAGTMDRDVGMMFAENRLFPTMSARKNIGFPLTVRGTREPERTQRVEAEASALQIESLLERMPGSLSSGQASLVQLARTMVRAPGLFLIDEPMVAVDSKTRRSLRAELRKIQKGYGVTTVYATHDQEDAMTLGDRLAIMQDGQIRQTGEPEEVYSSPEDTFVATFLGTPEMSLLTGRGRSGIVQVGELSLTGPRSLPTRVTIGVRPENWRIGLTGLRGTVTGTKDLGSVFYTDADTSAGPISMRSSEPIGERGAKFRAEPTAYHVFDTVDGKALYHHVSRRQR